MVRRDEINLVSENMEANREGWDFHNQPKFLKSTIKPFDKFIVLGCKIPLKLLGNTDEKWMMISPVTIQVFSHLCSVRTLLNYLNRLQKSCNMHLKKSQANKTAESGRVPYSLSVFFFYIIIL